MQWNNQTYQWVWHKTILIQFLVQKQLNGSCKSPPNTIFIKAQRQSGRRWWRVKTREDAFVYSIHCNNKHRFAKVPTGSCYIRLASISPKLYYITMVAATRVWSCPSHIQKKSRQYSTQGYTLPGCKQITSWFFIPKLYFYYSNDVDLVCSIVSALSFGNT